MSKKCCGMIYSDEEQTCKICGKKLDDSENIPAEAQITGETQGETDAGIAEVSDAEAPDTEAVSPEKPPEESDETDEEIAAKKKNKAPLSLRIVGVMSLAVAVLGLAMVVLCLYFMVLFPSYDRSGSSDKPLYFPETATASDVDMTSVRGILSPTDAISEDYFKESTANQDASASDASATDAEASDAGVPTE